MILIYAFPRIKRRLNMMKELFLNFIHLFLNLKECMIKVKKTQSNEEVIADLHTYLEHLNKKCSDFEVRIHKCSQKALYHKLQERELNRAKLYLKDKLRLQNEQDKAMKFTHVIRQQIDSLTTSELDSIMVDAMRQYNMTATQMGLPDRTREIEELGNDLQERFSEVTQLQQILGDATDPSALASTMTFNSKRSYEEDQEDLALELEALGLVEDTKVEPVTKPVPAETRTEDTKGTAQVEEEHDSDNANLKIASLVHAS
jgi:small nuclear ribonucleoprotein (snRNP)-like protein